MAGNRSVRRRQSQESHGKRDLERDSESRLCNREWRRSCNRYEGHAGGYNGTVQAAAQSSNGLVVSVTITITLGQSTSLTISSTPSCPISLASTGTGSTVQFAASLNGSDVTSRTT